MSLHKVLVACCVLVFCLGTIVGCNKPPAKPPMSAGGKTTKQAGPHTTTPAAPAAKPATPEAKPGDKK